MRGQTRDLFIVFGVDICKDVVCALDNAQLAIWHKGIAGTAPYRRNLLRQIDLLRYGLLPFQGTLLIHILHLFAQIRLLAEQFDQTIFHHDIYISSLFDFVGEVAFGFDCERLATEVAVSDRGTANSWRTLGGLTLRVG